MPNFVICVSLLVSLLGRQSLFTLDKSIYTGLVVSSYRFLFIRSAVNKIVNVRLTKGVPN